MAQGKRISANIDGEALQAIKGMGAAAKLARMSAGEGQAVAAARLGVHIQTCPIATPDSIRAIVAPGGRRPA